MESETLNRYEDYFHFFTGKLVIFRKDGAEVLLAQRKGEKEFDNCWSFPGGRKENRDRTVLENLRREKDEELGKDFRVRIFPHLAFLTQFVRKDSIPVVVACFPALYESGDVKLCEDYSTHRWCDVTNLDVEPLIANTEGDLQHTIKLLDLQKEEQGTVI